MLPQIPNQPPYPPYIPVYTPEQQERMAIKKSANLCSIGFLTLVIAPFAIGFLLGILLLFIPWLRNILSTDFGRLFLNLIITVPLFTVPFYIAALHSGVPMNDIFRFGKAKKKTVLPLTLTGFGLFALGEYATNIIGTTLRVFDLEPTVDIPGPSPGIWGSLFYMVALAAVPALVEEFAFRGMVLGVLRRFGDFFAILVSALFFALMHGNLVQAPFAFIIGLALGYAVVASGSIWPAVIIHFLNNFMVSLLNIIGSVSDTQSQHMIEMIYMFTVLMLGVAGILMLALRDRQFMKLDTHGSVLSDKDKVTAFCHAGGVLAVIICFSVMMFISLLIPQLTAHTKHLREAGTVFVL